MNLTKQELIELKNMLEELLNEINFQINMYSPKANDDEFDFLIKKAINYRDIISRINKELKEL